MKTLSQRALILFSLFFPTSFLLAQKTLSIYFDSDKYVLKTSETFVLNEVIDSLIKNADISVKLQGNTDADGSEKYNQLLSENRSKAISDYLQNHGIAAQRITFAALGESAPIAENSTDEGKKRNRRVDVFFQHNPKILPPSVSVRNFPFDKGKKYSIHSVYQKLDPLVQTFEISSDKDEIIVGEKGTHIRFSSNGFDVPPGTKVKVTLKEAYATSDILAQNLSTHADNQVLETRGMVKIEATVNGQPVKMKENYMLMMPQGYNNKDNAQRGMRLFTGETNTNNQKINWRTGSQPNFAFYFEANNAKAQKERLQKLLAKQTDTASCENMFVWTLDTPYLKRLQQDRQDFSNLPAQIISDEQPEGYAFSHVHKDSLSALCRELAAWAAPTHSWYRRIPWKEKHRLYASALYGEYYAPDYDSLVTALKKYCRLAEQAEKTLREAPATDVHKQQMATYYIFEGRDLGWINCDVFSQAPKGLLVNCETNIPAAPFTDVKIVFKKRRVVLDAQANVNGFLSFKNIAKDEPAVLVAVKIENGESHLAIAPITTAKMTYKLKFKAMTPEEMKMEMKLLDSVY